MDKNHFASVAGVVINENKDILLIKSPLRGWEFPGGMVEPGETLQGALKREIFEESGIKIDIIGFIGICKNTARDIINVDFCCKYISGKLTASSESSEVRWFSKDEAVMAVENELTKKRLKNMLSHSTKISCFSFTKEPFTVSEDECFKVGL
ncbi:NUDIX domain-containing protein [Paludicola sp. MB14-C6]|uniref:NUDIX hydrolase n=1 Tax=Paludihabitans sp. MB14-C6 TaxID=3070656 RepID=UPI0027DC8707|nr:NUDIX domain-containing protein [Paludicola sp. MB14-C6]WMJ22681.1 NUDIX domain-containing protein [Paludicola sp. MB14-C6]